MGGIPVHKVSEDRTQVALESKEGPRTFNFDHVFDITTNQADIYSAVGKPIVQDVFDGYNGTLFVYGQTGAGKSFTMMGPNVDGSGYCEDTKLKGIIPRIIEDIFDQVAKADQSLEFTIQVQYLEIYLEKLRDLLDPDSKKELLIKEDKEGRGIFVSGATEIYASSMQDMINLLKQGASNRVVESTRMNSESSRSHSIFIITMTQKDTVKQESKSGKLFLVDLAGSEKVKKTGAEGKVLEEAKNINKSLSALGNVINALTDGKSTHVPYRDSKLTRLLQDSLGGNSRTVMVINCSCSSYNEFETISTLRFGVRAKSIKNKPKVNRELSVKELTKLLNQANTDIAQLKKYVAALEKELKSVKGPGFDPASLVSGNAPSSAKSDVSQGEQQVEGESNASQGELQTRLADLEEKLNTEEEEKARLQDQITELREAIDAKQEMVQKLEEDIAQLNHKDVEIEELRAEREELKQQLEKADFSIKELNLTVESLNQQVAMMKSGVDEAELSAAVSDLLKDSTARDQAGDDRPVSRTREKQLLQLISDLQTNTDRLRTELKKKEERLGGVAASPIADESAAVAQNVLTALQQAAGPTNGTANSASPTHTEPVVEATPSTASAPATAAPSDAETVVSPTRKLPPVPAKLAHKRQLSFNDEMRQVVLAEVHKLKDIILSIKTEHFSEVEEYENEIQNVKKGYRNQAESLLRFLESSVYSKAWQQLTAVEEHIVKQMMAITQTYNDQLEAQRRVYEPKIQRLQLEAKQNQDDLTNRCAKVVELEMKFDELSDQFNFALNPEQKYNAQRFKELTMQVKQQADQMRAMKTSANDEFYEKEIKNQRDRIAYLENQIKQLKEEKAGLRTELLQRDEYIKSLKQAHANMERQPIAKAAPKIITPLRGGQKNQTGSSVQQFDYTPEIRPLTAQPFTGGHEMSMKKSTSTLDIHDKTFQSPKNNVTNSPGLLSKLANKFGLGQAAKSHVSDEELLDSALQMKEA